MTIKIGNQDGAEYAFLTCPHCLHNFTTWETIMTGGYMQQTGFIDSYKSSYDGGTVYTEGHMEAAMNGDWNTEHSCEKCGKDITEFIDAAFDYETDF